MDDHDLLAGIRRRDPRAFGELRARYQGLVLRRVDHVTHNRDLSEEVAQDIWLQLWQHPEAVDLERGGIGTWLRTVAHRRAVDCVRSVQAAHQRDVAYGLRLAGDVEDDPEHRAELLLERPRLRAALEQLTEHQRTAVVLRHLGDLSHVEIAERLGIAVGTGRSRYRDGFLRLQQLLRSA